MRKKYLGTRVVKPFLDEALGAVRDYVGEVQSVDFHPAEGCFMFQVEYASDSDEEDMEHWELKKYVVDV